MLKQSIVKINVRKTTKKHIGVRGDNVMNREDRFMHVYTSVENRKLRDQFDAQVAKMRTQPKHRFKDMLEIWEYAYEKIVHNQHQ